MTSIDYVVLKTRPTGFLLEALSCDCVGKIEAVSNPTKV